MGKKNKRLFDQIVDMDNIRSAYEKAKIGHSAKLKHLEFVENLNENLFEIQQQLIAGTYHRGAYSVFEVVEVGKRRTIYALPFRDSVVQHAINNIIEPIFDRGFYPCSYACRKNKGEHLATRHVQASIRKLEKTGTVFALQLDFRKYFASVSGKILWREILRKVRCALTLDVLRQFITHTGIRIGNLLSQLFANIYGHIFDRFVKTKLRVTHYFRYMDDTVILSNDKALLRHLLGVLRKFSGLYMALTFSRWQIFEVQKKGLNFLGYRIRAKYKLVRRGSVIRARRKILKYIKFCHFLDLSNFLASWRGHILHADSYNLKTTTDKILGVYA